MLTENSGLVKTWVNLINLGAYKEDDVPQISNLKAMVHLVLIST